MPTDPTDSSDPAPTLSIRTRLYCGEDIAMGPGKVALLEAIAREGSISAAGRALGMSYRRTWMLVDTMNRCWVTPLVETAAGGTQGGGARLTDLGQTVAAHYRDLEARIAAAAEGAAWDSLRAAMLPRPKPSQKG
ncbi:LysR family transcriptional regulator [Sphingobium sufflavum]|uniref:winged helix-turn-helix domain-containing protein n=1 Tax=Sphingobium sufflavum TaxID=1129547 RepID=UPI001F32809B|nr:LysR family transcriptional regulator [Sphingobium sufflavum]MCE7797175.1 LysR family transcriptional regulator [Sphingobium sufflavum]